MIYRMNIFSISAAMGICFAPSLVSAQNAGAGATVYKRCAVCHSVTGANGVGPTLKGVIGRKAGTVPKYTYSKAMAAGAVTWDKVSLDRFVAKPQAVVPGTKMGFGGLPNPKDRQDLIAYLATLKK